MNIGNVLFTHAVAQGSGKSPFFFSRWNFIRARERGNTHYCFYCGGDWGFTLGENGEVTNALDDKIVLYKADGNPVKNREALSQECLTSHLANTGSYLQLKPGDKEYEKWLDSTAYFDHSDEFEKEVTALGYLVYRYNPMEYHDPETHSNGIIGNMDKYDFHTDWLTKEKVPEGFPFIVSMY